MNKNSNTAASKGSNKVSNPDITHKSKQRASFVSFKTLNPKMHIERKKERVLTGTEARE